MILKLSTGKIATKHQFDDECSYLALINAIAEVVKLPETDIDILMGFPPKIIQPSNVNESAKSMGVVSGTMLTIRSNPDKHALAIMLRDLGFPSHKVITIVHSVKSLTLEDAIEFCEKLDDEFVTASKESSAAIEVPKKMVVWTIAADNSCLFNAIDFLLNQSTSLKGPLYYRRLVAGVIQANPTLYNEDFLEKKPVDYVSWILHPDKWGGEIELSILSTQLQVEIAVVDIQTTISLIYGSESGYDRRIYLIYDGSHYDAVVRTSDLIHQSPHLENYQSFFLENETDLLDEVKLIAQERKQKRQFTNLRSGSLLCKQCDAIFIGQKEAVEHAKNTGHTNFGEVV